jgi:hypothetical protein
MFTTPGGTPHSSTIFPSSATEAGVSEAGLRTTVLPQRRAGKSFQVGMASGKFQGVMRPQTPTGCRTDMASLLGSSDWVVSP